MAEELKFPPTCPKCGAVSACYHVDYGASVDTPVDEFSLICVDCGHRSNTKRTGTSYCMDGGGPEPDCPFCGRRPSQHIAPPEAYVVPGRLLLTEARTSDTVVIDWIYEDGKKFRQVMFRPGRLTLDQEQKTPA